MMKKLFGSKKEEQQQEPAPPKLHEMSKEQLNEVKKGYNKKLRQETREIDKQIFQMENLRKKAEQDLIKEVKKGATADKYCKTSYAKQIAKCTATKNRYLMSKAQIEKLKSMIDEFISTVKMQQIMGSSVQLMKQIGQMMNVKELSGVMNEFQKEMVQMGMISEVMDDAMAISEDDMDTGENENEIQKIIWEAENKALNKNVQQLDQMGMQQQQMNQPVVGQQKEIQFDDFEKQMQQLLKN